MIMAFNHHGARSSTLLFLFAWAGLATGETLPEKAASQIKIREPGENTPTAVDPYPLAAAGWGPEAGNGMYVSRWVEDWTGMRKAGNAKPLKAIPLGDKASLTLSAELRLRYDDFGNAYALGGKDYRQGLMRGILGADLRVHPNLRVYGELGTGQVKNDREIATANFQNNASLQQLFVEARGHLGDTLVGAMIGRQEFADGPRQLLSLSDGPNIHRTWNGLRLYVHGQRFRIGAFKFNVTRLNGGSFDEEINFDESIEGINAGFVVSPNNYLEPFWIHSENPVFRSGGTIGQDDRDTLGMRLWGRRGNLKYDWTIARQTGSYTDRDIDAWGLFFVQSVALSDSGWKPRFNAHIDVASGGGAYVTGSLKDFNPLYASSNYLGEGQFLSLGNLLLVAPGISASPTTRSNVSIEYGFARRLDENDAVYAGGMRAYAGTQSVPGHDIGAVFRLVASLSTDRHTTFFLNYEHLQAGDVLRRAGLPSSSYVVIGTTYRF
jgi:hypothetical protein